MQLQLPPKAPKTHRQHTEQSCRICFKRNGTKKHLQGLMEFESLKQDSAMWPSAHSVRPDWPRVGGKRAEMVWLPLKKGTMPWTGVVTSLISDARNDPRIVLQGEDVSVSKWSWVLQWTGSRERINRSTLPDSLNSGVPLPLYTWMPWILALCDLLQWKAVLS